VIAPVKAPAATPENRGRINFNNVHRSHEFSGAKKATNNRMNAAAANTDPKTSQYFVGMFEGPKFGPEEPPVPDDISNNPLKKTL
jgi:hypothetical protein